MMSIPPARVASLAGFWYGSATYSWDLDDCRGLEPRYADYRLPTTDYCRP